MYATTTIDGTIYFTDISTQKEYGRIVFRQLIDGLYSDPVVLDDSVNLPVGSAHPCIAPDGKYLFYLANRDIYWVSTEFIEKMRREKLE